MPSARGKLKAVRETRKVKAKLKKKAAQPMQLKLFKIFCLVFAVGVLGFFANSIYTSWAKSVWIPKTRITVAVATSDPKLYSYDPQTGKLISITIPKNTQVDTAQGYGQWLAGSLWGLGKQEKMGGDLMKLSLQKSLGIPIDAWTDEDGEALFKSQTLGFVSAFWEAFSLRNIKSDLTFFDRLNILTKIAQIKATDRKNIDLETAGVIKKTKLADGEPGYIIVPERSKVSLDILRDNLVYVEAKKIVVENATGKSGVAGNIAQIGAVLGARVIGVENSDETIADCVVRGEQKQLESVTASRLIKIFNCKSEDKKPSGPQDLEILLGRDFKERF